MFCNAARHSSLSIKGLAADVGALQRLPKLIGSQSLVRELCFTARKVDSKEATQCGLVSKVFDDKERYVLGCSNFRETACYFFHIHIIASGVQNDHVFDLKFNDHLSQIVQRLASNIKVKYGIYSHFAFNLMLARNNSD